MKKSAIYRAAQICVLESSLGVREKLEVLRELMRKEELELFTEAQEEKANEGV